MNDELFVSEDVTLLIVDDTPANIDVLRDTLRPQGYKISVATSGEQALKISEKLLPDLILLDVMMPRMNGFEVCAHLKQNPITTNIPVIFITAKTEAEDISKGFNVGGVDYITKPIRREEVCARVKTHLKLSYSTRKLKEVNASLQEINEQKNRFMGMVAHDLRTPLGAMLSFLDMIIQNEDSHLSESDLDEMHKLMYTTCQEMLLLVNDVLDISVVEKGSLNLDLQIAELNEIIEKRIKINRFKADEKGMKLSTSCSGRVNAYVDGNRLAQVIDNLLGNAIKFAPPGTRVDIELKEHNNYAMISVQDEGPGLTDDDMHELFSETGNLSAKPTSGEKSTGLGLAIVKKIIEAHSGYLEVLNAPEKGAVFNVCVPMKCDNSTGQSAERAVFMPKTS